MGAILLAAELALAAFLVALTWQARRRAVAAWARADAALERAQGVLAMAEKAHRSVAQAQEGILGVLVELPEREWAMARVHLPAPLAAELVARRRAERGGLPQA